jgi:hypothetical protein
MIWKGQARGVSDDDVRKQNQFIRSPINNRGGCNDDAVTAFPSGTVCRFAAGLGWVQAMHCQACFAVAAYAATTCLRLTGSKVLPVRGLLTSSECALPGTL